MTGPRRARWNLSGKRVVVTGATSGLGRVTAIELARMGAEVVLASRSHHKGGLVLEEVHDEGGIAHFVELELASLASVEAAARAISDRGPLDVLVNNAGMSGRGITEDGFELAFGVNYVGPFHLTRLLNTSFRTAARPRVVNVSSNAHFEATGIDFEAVRERTTSLTGAHEYAVSKLAVVLWSRELARRWPHRDIFCVHPGMVATPIWDRVPQPLRWLLTRRMISPEEGSRTQIRCVADPDLAGISGEYWVKEAPGRISPQASDDRIARELWDCTVGWLRGH